MAVENELKFVMPIEFNKVSLVGWGSPMELRQAYLNCNPFISLINGRPVLGLNFRKNGKTIAFETTEIEQQDFDTLKSSAKTPPMDGRIMLNEKSVRLRREGDQRYITYKQLVNDDLIEIEDSNVDPEIFDALYPHCIDPIHKIRYEQKIGDEKWFVDFLLDRTSNNSVYFSQAEVEMPAGRKKPQFMPPEIAKNAIFHVPRNDTRFTNRNLSIVEDAKALYVSLLPK